MEQESRSSRETRRSKRAEWHPLRSLRLALGRRPDSLGLTFRFLVVSIVVIASAVAVLGTSISGVVRSGITEGVSRTAAASIDSLVTNLVGPVVANQTLSDTDRAQLDQLFQIGCDAETTRLIQLRIFRLTGELLYEASEGIVDPDQTLRFELAKAGQVSSEVMQLSLIPNDPLGSHPISVLRLYTPLHQAGTGQVFAIAALYYSARALVEIQGRAQTSVWIAVSAVGVAVVALLLVFVAAADRTIVRQARRLSSNLEESRQLSEEVKVLHRASEQLRIEAIEANEQLLARVGSDIHDGPLQLLTLSILQLTRFLKSGERVDPSVLEPAAALTSQAMNELRGVSTGLILPELAGLTLADTLRLAVQRHEAATGSTVSVQFEGIDHRVESDVQVCLYRVVQESLSNAFRHSDGRDQSVTAAQVEGTITLEVANTTKAPVDAPASAPRVKLGVRGMRLRLEAVGGGMVVEMRDDRTIVRAVVPSAVVPDASSWN